MDRGYFWKRRFLNDYALEGWAASRVGRGT